MSEIQQNPQQVLFVYDNGVSTANLNGRVVQSSIKPDFSFKYDALNSIKNINTGEIKGFYVSNGVGGELSESQLKEIQSYINSIKIDETIAQAHKEYQEKMMYLRDTDYIEQKYTRDVLRDKIISEAEFNVKYEDILTKRKYAIKAISKLKTILNI
jgi:hypothetical protein